MIDYVMPLATSDGTQTYKDQRNDLPAALHGACITTNGQLTPDFSYIGRMRKERERNTQKRKLELMEESGGSTVLRISGRRTCSCQLHRSPSPPFFKKCRQQSRLEMWSTPKHRGWGGNTLE